VKREHGLAAAIVDTLLRENYGGYSDFVISGSEVGGSGSGSGSEVRVAVPGLPVVPLVPDGFLADYRVDRSAVTLTLDDVDALVAALADPADAAGVAAFRAECRQALAGLRLRDAHAPGPGHGYEAAAARLAHPAYPTWAARSGWSDEDSLRYGPEFAPEFALAWAAVPSAAVVRAGTPVPSWWPGFGDVGLPPSLAAGHELFPVHPLTVPCLPDWALVAPLAFGSVRPTLSVRTVDVLCAPGTQLKLPLGTSTLGLRNKRAIVPGTLADGALMRRVLATIVARDSGLDRLLLADDGNYAHAGHPYLGYLLRLLPADLLGYPVVPVAALLAPAAPLAPSAAAPSPSAAAPTPSVAEELAGGDLLGWFGEYCSLVFGIAVRLFVRYGIALESHQQNAALVRGHLLVKDFDGALVNYPRLVAALGPAAPGRAEFADQRLLTDSDDDLANVFITITVHLCAGAIAFGLAERGRAPLPVLISIVRKSLVAALDEYGGSPSAALLAARVLAAGRLPGKAMVTAGTLTEKSRTGARDINKYYGTTGPNYLR
jgi:siderophore synthetase component